MPTYRTVGEVFNKPRGPVTLDSRGRWWITRESLAVEDGNVTVQIGDGFKIAEITGTPNTLRRLAKAIIAQVEGAEVNTPKAGA